PAVVGLIEEVGRFLGVAVGDVMNMLNPAIIVLGGEITGSGELLLDAVRRSIRGRTQPVALAETRIVMSELSDRAIAIGAATLVLQAALADRTLFPELKKTGSAP